MLNLFKVFSYSPGMRYTAIATGDLDIIVRQEMVALQVFWRQLRLFRCQSACQLATGEVMKGVLSGLIAKAMLS